MILLIERVSICTRPHCKKSCLSSRESPRAGYVCRLRAAHHVDQRKQISTTGCFYGTTKSTVPSRSNWEFQVHRDFESTLNLLNQQPLDTSFHSLDLGRKDDPILCWTEVDPLWRRNCLECERRLVWQQHAHPILHSF